MLSLEAGEGPWPPQGSCEHPQQWVRPACRLPLTLLRGELQGRKSTDGEGAESARLGALC